jgi:hypothetical protein
VLALLISLLLPVPALADAAACRTPWQMHHGEGVVDWGFDMGSHGNIAEYDYATIPPLDDPAWSPPPSEQFVDYDLGQNSTLCNVVECRYGGEFTYFMTVVYLPTQMTFSSAWVDVLSVDDGVRMTVFNGAYPDGITDPNGYAFLPAGVSSDLLPYMANEAYNTVVLTHVDDCCSNAWITGVDFYVEVEGRPESVPIDCDLSDDDGDGYPPAGGDCDDDDPAIHPGQPEVADGVDQDCDDLIDEGTDAFDDDGDGSTEQDGDCDDGNPNFHPGAEELCEGETVDLDCDGCPGVTDPDCGGTCGEDPADDDDSAAGDDDDVLQPPDDDDSAAVDEGLTPGDGCSCYQSVSAGVLFLPLLGWRRRRSTQP